ncbi:AMP-binding protein [Streptomyces sp. NPDC058052]|uniref:AMP-binding protein n=1 Tax=Streptomyces sp. NPDC058052 TaxID=3346316 RepID=UPI0036EE7569
MSRGLAEAFAAHAAERPEAPALVWEDRPVGYGELYAMADRARTRVEAAVPGPDHPVGLLVRKSPEAVALVLGCLMAGRSFLLPSRELPEEPLRSLYAQAGCRAVLSTEPHPLADHVVDLTGPATDPGPARPPAPVADDAVGFMLTTSGSTGLPKIVPVPTGAVTRFTAWAGASFPLGPGARVLNYAPLNFDLCLLDIWSTLAHGGTVVLADPDRGASPSYLRDLVADHGVTLIQGVPLLFQLLIEATADTGPLTTPEHIVFAGESTPGRVLDSLEKVFPDARWYNNYGCTETNNSFLHTIDRTAPVRAPLPIGRPLPGVSWLIAGADGEPVTGQGRGELLVSTPFQTAGYLNAPNDRFAPHPDGEPGLVYYRTGDVVTRHEDGTVSVLGRTDFMVKVRGFQISTQSVEQVLLDHPDVVEAAVIALPDPVAGKRLHAVLRVTAPGAVSTLALRSHCARHVVRAAVPTAFDLTTDPLPKTSTGKVDRNLVRRGLEAAATTG